MPVIDFTRNNQLSSITGMTAGLDIPQFYPYLTEEGEVYALIKFEEYANYRGYSMGDWEPERETLPYDSAGTITIASGIVTGDDTTFSSDFPFNVIKGRLYVGEEIYGVASRNSSTQLTLVNTSVNVPTPSAYKFARWDHREIDPKYAFNAKEWQDAHSELAYPLELVRADALANGARLCLYDFLDCLWRRANDIIDDLNAGLYETWQSHVETVLTFETAQGRTLIDYVKETNGLLIWDSEVPDAYDDGPTNRARWLTRNERIMDTLDALDVPHAPLFMRHTLDGLGEFVSTGTGTEVTEGLQRAMVAQAHARQPFKYAWWGIDHVTHGPQYAGYALPATLLAEQLVAASTTQSRRSAAGVPFWPSVTPDADKDHYWRRDAAASYGPVAAVTSSTSTARSRRSAAGIPFWPSVTPSADKDGGWRRDAAASYGPLWEEGGTPDLPVRIIGGSLIGSPLIGGGFVRV